MSANLPDKKTFSISEAARFLGVSPETLRRWDRKGILKPYRTKGNQRRYSLGNLEAFKAGEKAPGAPLSISQAAKYVGVHPETLRRWEKEGVIAPQRTNGNQRRYTRGELDQVKVKPEAPLPAPLSGAMVGVAPPPSPPPPPSLPPRIRVRTMEEFRPSPFPRLYLLGKLAVVTLALVVASFAWGAVPPLSKARIGRFFATSPLNPIVDVNDVFEYSRIPADQDAEARGNVWLRSKFSLEVGDLVTNTLRVFKDGVFNTTRLLGTVFFGKGERYFITPLADAYLRNLDVGRGKFTVSGETGATAIKTPMTSGTALEISFESPVQTGDLTGIEVDFSKIVDPLPTDTRYGVHLKDSPEPTAADYGVYVEGTNWDYGIYSEDDVYIDGTLEVNNETTISGNLLPGIDSIFDIGAVDQEWANLYVDTLSGSGGTLSSLTVTGTSDLQGDVLDTTGNLTLNDSVDISEDLSIGGDLTVTGTGTHSFAGTLDPDQVDAFTLTGDITGLGSPNITNIGQFSGTSFTDGTLTITGGNITGGLEASFSTKVTTPEIENTGNITLDAVNASVDSTISILNSNPTYEANLDVEGDLTVGGSSTFTGHLLPSADDQYDLGSATARWRDLYLGPASLNIYRTIGADAEYFTIGYDATPAITFSSLAAGAGTARNFNFTGGSVGIATTTPDFALDVSGDVRIEGSNNLYFGGAGASADVNLYRSVADTLKTDDTLVVGTQLELPTDKKVQLRDPQIYMHSGADGYLNLVADGAVRLSRGGASAGKLEFWDGSAFSINLYAGTSNVLETDDSFWVGTEIRAGYWQALGSVAFKTLPSGDTSWARFFILNSGELQWGPGNAPGDTNLYRSAADTLKTDDSLVIVGDLTASGQGFFNHPPTQAHGGVWAIGSGTWNQGDASIYINPATSTGDGNLIAGAVDGSVKFAVDSEGDIHARNLILTGSISQATMTIAGDLIVQGNTTLGDASADALTLYPNTVQFISGSSTLDITAAGDTTLTIDNSGAGVAHLSTTGDLTVGGDDIKDSGGNIVLSFDGSGKIDSVATLLTGTALTFRDAQLTIYSFVDGQLDIDADSEVEITAPTTQIVSSTAFDVDGGAITIDGSTLFLDSTDTTHLTMTANAAGDKTMTIAASNAGAGAGLISVTASGNITLDTSGGTLYLNETNNQGINTGTGNFVVDTTGSILADSATTVSFDAVTDLDLGTSNDARNIAIGTGNAIDTINIGTGGTATDVIAIGDSSASLALTDTDWSITSAGIITTTGLANLNGGIAVDTDNFTVSGTSGATSITTSATTGDVFNLSFDAATTQGAGLLQGLDIDLSNLTAVTGQNLYGLSIQDTSNSTAALAGDYYALYQQGTNWDYGGYFEDNVYIGGTLTGSGSGTFGYWSRTGTILSPATSGDDIALTDDDWIGISASDERIIFDTAGDIEIMGANVGIGEISPNAKLDFAAATAAAGGIEFGDDVTLYRSAANVLKTDDSFEIGGDSELRLLGKSSAGVRVLRADVSGDSHARFKIEANGKIYWGPGDATQDTNLYRSGADTLRTDDSFQVADKTGLGSGSIIPTNQTVFVKETYTNTSGEMAAIYSGIAANPTSASTGNFYGAQSAAEGFGDQNIGGLWGTNAKALYHGTGTVSSAAGNYASLELHNAGGTINNAYSFYTSRYTKGHIENSFGLKVGDTQIGDGTGTVTSNYGVWIDDQRGGSTDIGIRIGDADTYALQLASNDGDAASGITFGADTNLYRSAANTLKTDDSFIVGGDLTVQGAGDNTFTGHIIPSADDQYDLGSTTARWQDLYLGPSSLNIYRTIGTDAEYFTIGYDGTPTITFSSLFDGAGTARNFNFTGGNVGIGAASPDGLQINAAVTETADGSDNVRLGVVGGTPRIIFEDSGSTQWEIDNSGGELRFLNPGVVQMKLTTGGDLSVGSTGNTKIYAVSSTAGNTPALTLRNTGNTSAPYFEFQLIPSSTDQESYVRYNYVGATAVTDILVVKGTGYVGIGKTSPSSRLHVVGSSSIATVGTSNILTADGTFDTSNGWTVGAGWTIGSSVASHATGNTEALSGTSTATSTATVYQVNFTVAVTTAGTGFTVSLGGRDSGNTFTTAGTRTIYIKPANSTGTLSFTPGSGGTFVGTIDTVTIYALTASTADSLIESSDGTLTPLEIRAGGSNKYNSFIGDKAGAFNTTGNYNSAMGYQALYSNTTGTYNSAVGVWALFSNTTASYNTAVGRGALYANTTGTYNSAIGSASLQSNTTGSYNAAVGGGALFSTQTGNNNTALGYLAGNDNVAGSGNVFLGYNAGYDETGSDKLYIANSSGTPLIYGDFSTGNVGIGTTSPSAYLEVQTPDADYPQLLLARQSNVSGATLGLRAYDSVNNWHDYAAVFGGIESNIDGSEDGFFVVYVTKDGSGVYSAGSEKLRITSSGHVGIGDTGPDALLEVSASTGASDFLMLSSNDALDGDRFIVKNDGSVGIGTTSVDSGIKLQLNGNIRVDRGTAEPDIHLDRDISGTYKGFYLAIGGAGELYFARSTGKVYQSIPMTILTNDNVGIGTVSPDQRLDVGSGAVKTGSGYAVGTRQGSNYRVEGGTYTCAFGGSQYCSGSVTFSVAFSSTPVSNCTENDPSGQRSNTTCQTFNTSTTGFSSRLADVAAEGRNYTATVGWLAYGTTTMTDFDLAESYKTKDQSINSGDVVCIDPENNSHIVKCQNPYDPTTIGIVSTEPGLIIGEEPGPNSRLVGLQGRVPVKVTLENGPIGRGDLLTPSATKPGYAMKATKPGQIVGKALQPFNGKSAVLGENAFDGLSEDRIKEIMRKTEETGEGQTMAFINISWYDPDVYLTSTGELKISAQMEQIDADETDLLNPSQSVSFTLADSRQYELRRAEDEVIERVGVFSEVATAYLKAGRIDTQELFISGQSLEEYLKTLMNAEEEILVDAEGDLAQVNADGTATKIIVQTVEAEEGIFERITSTISAVFNKITAKTAEIAEAVIQTLRVEKLFADSAEVKEFSVTETSGRAVVAAGESNKFVENTYVGEQSKVFITFKDPYRPATQHWVSELKEGEGFTLTLDQAVESEASFDYWIVN